MVGFLRPIDVELDINIQDLLGSKGVANWEDMYSSGEIAG